MSQIETPPAYTPTSHTPGGQPLVIQCHNCLLNMSCPPDASALACPFCQAVNSVPSSRSTGPPIQFIQSPGVSMPQQQQVAFVNAQRQPQQQVVVIQSPRTRPKYDLNEAYMFCGIPVVLACCCGWHHLYLDNPGFCVLSTLTLGGCGIWALIDLMNMRDMVHAANMKFAPPQQVFLQTQTAAPNVVVMHT